MSISNVTILCIDDEETICFALKALFRTQNWVTCTAGSVTEGLAMFQNCHPDIVLIDYHMPGINGVTGVKLLRKLSPDVPIIVFTIDESQEVADAFLAVGASDFALKPIKAPDIVSRIKLHLRLLEQRGSQRNLAKGISQGTVDLILDFLHRQEDYVTASETASGTGLAYQTAYRYLQYTTQEGLTEMESLYGRVGRPKQVYRIARREQS